MINAKITSLHRPESPLPLVFDSPHSGRHYPDDFGFSCDFKALQKAEDNYVDDLFEMAPDYGGTLLCALFPRTYIDVNRAADDIDPDVLSEDWPFETNPSDRSHAGIGLIRRVVKPGMTVYNRKLYIKEVQQRIENYYKPYHDELAGLIEDSHYKFGQSWHINCHSMPQGRGMARSLARGAASRMPDFVLGDRDGTSCDIAFTHALRDFLKGQGYRVSINNPYRGVELVRRYADPATGRHSIQIEINKALYWDEEKNVNSSNYNALKSDIEKLIKYCADCVLANLSDMAAD